MFKGGELVTQDDEEKNNQVKADPGGTKNSLIPSATRLGQNWKKKGGDDWGGPSDLPLPTAKTVGASTHKEWEKDYTKPTVGNVGKNPRPSSYTDSGGRENDKENFLLLTHHSKTRADCKGQRRGLNFGRGLGGRPEFGEKTPPSATGTHWKGVGASIFIADEFY